MRKEAVYEEKYLIHCFMFKGDLVLLGTISLWSLLE